MINPAKGINQGLPMTTQPTLIPQLPRPNPALGETQALEVRLAQVASLLADATSTDEMAYARNAARYCQQAAVILKNQRMTTQSSILVADAERAIAYANPALTPSQAGKLQVSPREMPFTNLELHKFRSAHVGLSDEKYLFIRRRALASNEPLSRKQLSLEATRERIRNNQPDATRLSALPYIGGKSSKSPYGVGQWINSFLPYDPNNGAIYAEPFGGMAGIMLQRPPTRTEIYNDINKRAVNWFLCVRRWPEDLKYACENTPFSEYEYLVCSQTMDEGTCLERARKFAVVMCQGLMATDNEAKLHWSMCLGGENRNRWPGAAKRMTELSDRLRSVMFSCRDALDVLKRIEEKNKAVVFCDPPYGGDSDQTLYRNQTIDRAKLANQLRRMKGRVLISGNAGEYDHLLPGWDYRERQTTPAYRSHPAVGPARS